MKLKKLSAFFALLSIALLLGHVGYTIVSYSLFLYNPMLTKIFAVSFLVCACLHGIFAMLSVFWQGEGTALSAYPKQNMSTVLQRGTAAVLFPMIVVHMNMFSLLSASVNAGRMWLFWLLLVCQVLFYGAVITHVTVSFSKALMILGLLSSQRVQKGIDRVMMVLGALVFAGASFVVISTQLKIFLK